MNQKTTFGTDNISKSRKVLFNLIIAILPIIIVLLLEFVLRIFGYGDNLSLFVNNPDEAYKEYKMVNPVVGKKYFQKFEYSAPPKDIFLKEKPDSCFRIFVMGSSTVVGFPYDNNLMFSRILHERLREAYPTKKIEVVNTAITAINSFTLLDFMPQILREKPDAILFYAGHNEFYGAFGVGSNEAVTHNAALINLHLKCMNSRVYQLTRNIISGVTGVFSKRNTASEKRGTLMTRIVKNADITYDSKEYSEGMKYYERNLDLILAMAKQKNVPFFISDLVSNIKDLKPFNSIATDKLKPAIEYYNKAVQDEQKGDYKAAKENYQIARDYDCIRFRASGEVNEIIKKISEKYKAYFVPTLELFETYSPNGLIGENFIVEHVHPNIEGYFLMSESFYNSIIESKLIDKEPNEFAPVLDRNYISNYGFTELDYLTGKHRITNLKYHWPFVDESKGFTDYRLIYKPKNFIDSLSFQVMVSPDLSLLDAHNQLALIYEQNKNIFGAYREYNALSKMDPYWAPYFKKAADYLLVMNDLPGALKYYSRSLEWENTFYAHYRSGEICMIKNDIDNAVSHFEKALPLAEKDKLNVLKKLLIAYVYKGEKDKADKIHAEIVKENPSEKIDIPKRMYTFMNYIPAQVSKYIEQASIYLNEGNTEGAEHVLLQSLDVKDSHVANRMLGDIYYNRNDMSESLYYFRKVYKEFDSDPRFLNVIALNYIAAGNKKKAAECVDRLKVVAPKYPDIQVLEQLCK